MKEKFSLKNIKANPKIPFLIACAAAIAIIVVAFLWAQSTPYSTLFGNINDKDGGEIVSQLEQMKIPYKFSSNGSALLIPEDKVYETRLRLAQKGLPKNGSIGFELLDKERFGISQFSEQINYQRALEGELSRTIATLGDIENARVHLALPKPSLFVRERKSPTASVTLTLTQGRALSQEQINAITHLISSSVSELEPEQVTIVDQHGDLLTHDKMRGIHMSATQLEFTEKIEDRIRGRIEKILIPLLGRENLSVQVSADVDFSKHESSSDMYDPNSDIARQSIRSKQKNEQRQNGANNGIGGVPGALSNQPVPVATAPIDDPDQIEGPPNANDEKNKDDKKDKAPLNFQQSEIVNYEVNRKTVRSQTPEGNIKRLSVAVLVNYRLAEQNNADEGTKQEEMTMVLKPLDENVIQKIESLTKGAMGFSQDRGDSITVANLQFSDKTESSESLPIWKEPEFYYYLTTLGRYLIFMLIAWLVWSKILKPQWNKLQQRYEISSEESAPDQASNKIEEEKETRDMRYKRIFEDSMQQQKYLREVVKKDPKMTANILRNWISRGYK